MDGKSQDNLWVIVGALGLICAGMTFLNGRLLHDVAEQCLGCGMFVGFGIVFIQSVFRIGGRAK